MKFSRAAAIIAFAAVPIAEFLLSYSHAVGIALSDILNTSS
jgi:hypothetical protein